MEIRVNLHATVSLNGGVDCTLKDAGIPASFRRDIANILWDKGVVASPSEVTCNQLAAWIKDGVFSSGDTISAEEWNSIIVLLLSHVRVTIGLLKSLNGLCHSSMWEDLFNCFYREANN